MALKDRVARLEQIINGDSGLPDLTLDGPSQRPINDDPHLPNLTFGSSRQAKENPHGPRPSD